MTAADIGLERSRMLRAGKLDRVLLAEGRSRDIETDTAGRIRTVYSLIQRNGVWIRKQMTAGQKMNKANLVA